MPKAKTHKRWLEEAKEIWGDKFDYSRSEYKGYSCYMDIKCNDCGNEFSQLAYAHIRRDKPRGCSVCSKKVKVTPEAFVKRCKAIHKDKYDYSLVKFKSPKEKVKIICNTCVKWNERVTYFEQYAQHHMNRGSGCPTCHMKNRGFKSEEAFGKILYSYFPTHTFTKTRPDFLLYPKSGRKLELDFYCKELGIAFEVNGAQHYEFVKYFHGDESGLAYALEKDKFKKKACLENGVKLYSFDLRTLPGNKKLNDKIMHEYIANIKNKLFL